MMEVITSNKGGQKLILNGFIYTKQITKPRNIRWRCVQRTTDCKATLTTTLDLDDPKLVTAHNQVTVQGCFYHLTQSTWRKVQDLGLTQRYKDSEDVKLFCGMMDSLALLPIDDLPAGLEFLRNNTPEGMEPLLNYMESQNRTFVWCFSSFCVETDSLA